MRAALPGITEQDLDNPFMLIGRLDAGARLTVPESILADLSRQAARRRFAALRPDAEFGPRQEALADKSFLDQLAMAQERGLVERAHDLLSARIEFSQGRLTVNDRPFDPAAFQE